MYRAATAASEVGSRVARKVACGRSRIACLDAGVGGQRSNVLSKFGGAGTGSKLARMATAVARPTYPPVGSQIVTTNLMDAMLLLNGTQVGFQTDEDEADTT